MEATRSEHAAASSAEGLLPSFRLEDKGLVECLTDCLSFSPAFTLTGFETVNDTLLKEMNERARKQLEFVPNVPSEASRLQARPANAPTRVPTKSAAALNSRPRPPPAGPRPAPRSESQGRLHRAPLQQPPVAPRMGAPRASVPRMAPPHRAPSHMAPSQIPLPQASPPQICSPQMARLAPLDVSPKRTGSGPESPTKRLRARGGAPAAAPLSPTSSLSQLSLSEKERLSKVSDARHQTRRENASPRRRALPRPAHSQSLNARPLPPLRLDSPTAVLPRAREPLGKSQGAKSANHHPQAHHPQAHHPQAHHPQTRAAGPASGRPAAQLPRSASRELGPNVGGGAARSPSARSVSADAAHSAGTAPRPAQAAEADAIPSYARPTIAALRRSQSTTVHQHSQQGFAQRVRASSSSRSISRLLN